MNISPEHIARVGALGYTPDEARFLYLVATFSGYFVPRQFVAFAGAKWGKRSAHFITKLESRGHATWREHLGAGGVYHLFSWTLYRAIDKQDLRNRRRHSSEFIRTRLLLLDFILANQAYNYLETEADRISYFCQTRAVPKTALPAKALPGSYGLGPRLHFFVDKFPVFLDESGDPSAPSLTLCYIDAGDTSIARFAHHLKAYQRLLANLTGFRFLYVSNSAVNFPAAERTFGAFAKRALRDDPSAELVRYFTLRDRWDRKQYGSFSPGDLEWLNDANGRFRGQEIECLYAEWRSGELTGAGLAIRMSSTRRAPAFHFSPWLVSQGQKATKELEKAG
jgi:hypothetical protein